MMIALPSLFCPFLQPSTESAQKWLVPISLSPIQNQKAYMIPAPITISHSPKVSNSLPGLHLSDSPSPLSRFGIETLSFDLRTQCLAFVKYILMQSCHCIGLEICNSLLSSETLIHQFCFALKLGSSSQGAPWKVSLLSMDRSRGHFSKQLYFSKLLWETIFYLRTPL